MTYCIEYTALCNKGLVRTNNQDNFWCMGEFLESENDGLAEPINGIAEAKDAPAFVVFDGMGGEQQGEVAAYIAAHNFDVAYKKNPKKDIKQFLLDTCAGMNKAICEHTKEKHIRSSGSTAAILVFGKKDIYICNIGDSRIYQHSGKKLTQITHDHCETSVTDRKPPLTQNLGINETDFIIALYIAKGIYENGDRYLICSDGLTDMVSEEEIAKTISESNRVKECAEALMQKALDMGGHDNITIILCEVQKTNWTSGLNKTIQKIYRRNKQ